MARVNTYTQDSVVSGIDKVLGTDVHTGATKNFTFNSVSEWLNSAGAVKIIGQNNYVFQSVGEFPADRLAGNISFLNFGGDGTLFSDVTELIFSDASAGNTSAAPYITTLVGKQVILANLKDLSNFGVYTLQSFIELDTEPGFYQATLVFINGSGALEEAEAYGIAAEGLQAQGGTWGSIAGTITDQTDLVDYVDAEIAAIPTPETPTLESVTNEGNYSGTSIGIGSYSYPSFSPSTMLHIKKGDGGLINQYALLAIEDTSRAGISITTSNTGRGHIFFGNANNSDYAGITYNHLSQTLSWTANGVARWKIDGNGNVLISGNLGVNTPTPSYPVHITGDTYISTGVAVGTSLVYANGVNINNSGQYRIGNAEFISKNANDMNIYQGRMWVQQAGNVGIGTTSPSEKLHVDGNTKIQGNIYLNDATERYIYGYNNLSYIKFYDPSFGGIEIGSTVNHKVRVVTSRLEVTGDFSTGGGFTMSGDLAIGNGNRVESSAGNNGITLYNSSDASMIFQIKHPTVGHYIYQDKDGNELMRLTRDGKLGIGTTSPAISLDVDGEVHLGPQSTTGFPSIDIASNGRTTIRGSAPALSVRDNNNNGGYIDMGGGTLAGINSITSSAQLSFSSTNVRFGGDTAARVNIIGQNSSSQYVLGLRQGSGGSNILLSAQDSTGAQVIGITANGGFYARDSNLIKRYVFDHDFSPSPADGLTTGFEFRTENKNGVVTTFGYIDVTNDDRTLQKSSMRFSVGETTPTEIMRLQSDGNVGIGTTSPTEKLHVEGNVLVENNLHVKGDLTVGKISNDTELVDVGGNFNFDTVAEPQINGELLNFTATVQGVAGNIDNGDHTYTVIYKTADGGETGSYNATGFKTITITDNLVAGQVLLTDIPVSPDPRVVARDIYRTEANDSPYYGKKLTTINDNTTTTYTDNSPDSALDQDTQFYRKANTTAGIVFLNNIIISAAPSPHRTSYGNSALSSVTIGQDNVAMGGASLQNTTSGKQNTAIGYSSGVNNTTGENNTYLGYVAGFYNDTGVYNTYVGSFAGRNNNLTKNNYNTGVGGGSLYKLTTDNSWNTAIGYFSGSGAQGQWNLHLGYYAGYKSTPATIGSFNIHIGTFTGQTTTGSGNILIGREIEAPTPSGSDQLNIGNLIYATGLGYGTTQSTGNVGIGTTTPAAKLDVTGNIKASGTIKGKMEQMFACNFIGDIGTTKYYIPFTTGNEQTNVHADQSCMIMPYHGRVKAIQMRLSNIDNACTRTFGIETVGIGTNMYAASGNWTVQETESFSLEAEDSFKLVTYVFDDSEHFRDGDLMAISIQDDTDAYTTSRQVYINVIVEYNLNDGLGNDTSTTKYES